MSKLTVFAALIVFIFGGWMLANSIMPQSVPAPWSFFENAKPLSHDELQSIKFGEKLWTSVDEKQRTEDFWVAAVEYGKCLLVSVPDSMRTERICLAAMTGNPENIVNVPESLITTPLIKTGLESEEKKRIDSSYYARKYPYFSYDLFGASFSRSTGPIATGGAWLNLIPDSAWTSKMAKEVCVTTCNLSDVPARFLSEDVLVATFEEASTYSGSRVMFQVLSAIPDDQKSEAFCLAAVKAKPAILGFLPKKRLTNDFFIRVAIQNPGILVDGKIEGGRYLRTLWEPNRSDYEKIVRVNGEALGNIPWQYRDKKMCLVALENGNAAWDFVPKKLVFDDDFMSTLASR